MKTMRTLLILLPLTCSVIADDQMAASFFEDEGMEYEIAAAEPALQKFLTEEEWRTVEINSPKTLAKKTEKEEPGAYIQPVITSYMDFENNFETDLLPMASLNEDALQLEQEAPPAPSSPFQPNNPNEEIPPFVTDPESVLLPPSEQNAPSIEDEDNDEIVLDLAPDEDQYDLENEFAPPEPEEDEWKMPETVSPGVQPPTTGLGNSEEVIGATHLEEFIEKKERPKAAELQKEAISPSPIPNSSDSIQDYNNPYNELDTYDVPPLPYYMEPMAPPGQEERQFPQDQSLQSPEYIQPLDTYDVPPMPSYMEPMAPPGEEKRQLPQDQSLQSPEYIQPEVMQEVPEAQNFKAKDAAPLDCVCVTGFRITGATLMGQGHLQGLVAPYAGQQLTFDELNDVAYVITHAYHCAGFPLARAYLPEQDITDGCIEIAVLEPLIDRILIERCGKTRLCDSAIRMLLGPVACHAYVDQCQLEEALLLLNDLPGIGSRFCLKPGTKPNTTSLLIQIREKPLISGSVETNNYGNRYTGIYQVGGRVNINDLFGYGDLLSAQAFYTGEWLQSGRISFITPVNYLGTKVGVSAAYTVYTLGSVFNVLNATGTAGIYSVFANHPLYLSRTLSLYLYGNFDYRQLKDVVQSGSSTKKQMEILKVGFSGNSADHKGINAFNGGVSVGNLNFASNGTATDPYAFGSKGAFGKFSLAMSRLQKIAGEWCFYASFAGQLTTRNLDGSEQMYLGGPYAIRAYPTGEAPGDSVYIGTIEIRYSLMPWMRSCTWLIDEISVKGFLDAGSSHNIKQNPSLPEIPKSRSLAGAGLGIDLAKCGFLCINLAWAHKIAGSSAQSNGKNSVQQFWARVEALF